MTPFTIVARKQGQRRTLQLLARDKASAPTFLRFLTMASLSSFGSLSAKHIDDSVHVCDCCGRTNLKATVLMVDNETGAEFNFGRVCAARNSGKTSQQLNRELREERFNATCRAGNQLFSLRRQGTFLTKSIVMTVCNEQKVHAEDLPMMIRTWAK